MIISRQEYAAGLLLAGNLDWYYYDDLGCFALDYEEFKRGGKDVVEAKVVDFKTKSIIDAKIAHYVYADPKSLWTPMSYGFVAFEQIEAAVEAAEKYKGEVKTFEGLIEWAKKRL